MLMTPITQNLNRFLQNCIYFSHLRKCVYVLRSSSLCIANQPNAVSVVVIRKYNDYQKRESYISCKAQGQAKVGKTEDVCVTILKAVLGLSVNEVESLIRERPDLKFVNLKNAQSVIEFLEKNGVSVEVICQNPWLLLDKRDVLSSKVILTRQMNLDNVVEVLPLLQIPLQKLRERAIIATLESQIVPNGSRIKYVCEKLESNLTDVCTEFVKHDFMFTIPFDRFSSIMDLLLEAGVSPEHTLKDVWVFRYNVNSIRERLQVAKEAGVTPIKPWMLRCSNKNFLVTVQRASTRKQLLGETSVKDFLLQQLQCDEETLKALCSRHPSLIRVHVSKLKEILDFLYREGYTPKHVCHVPRILFHSIDTLKTRLAEMRTLSYNPRSLIVLCKTKREYAQFFKYLRKKSSGS